MTNKELIGKAVAIIKPTKKGSYVIGDTACALISGSGNLYTGVCIDVGSGMGFCAEHNAIGSMVTKGEFIIRKLVAVGKDDSGKVFVLPPCGRCREFICQIDEANLDTEIVLSGDKILPLKELLPYHDWWGTVE